MPDSKPRDPYPDVTHGLTERGFTLKEAIPAESNSRAMLACKDGVMRLVVAATSALSPTERMKHSQTARSKDASRIDYIIVTGGESMSLDWSEVDSDTAVHDAESGMRATSPAESLRAKRPD